MKIVLGICGFGNGHISRQRRILEKLIGAGHQVIVLGHDNSYRHMRQHFPTVPLFEVKVPVIHPRPNGIDFLKSAEDENNRIPDAYSSTYRIFHEVEKAFGRPDMVLSDYEMVAAQVAYVFDAPLMTLDQQSKFLGYHFPPIGNFTPEEHCTRLRLFFPKAAQRVATSFFTVDYDPIAEYRVDLIPPIMRQAVAQLGPREPRSDNFVVYLSSAGEMAQTTPEIVAFLKQYPKLHFTLFASDVSAGTEENITFCPFDQQRFLESVQTASGIIATAGHNLITEAIYLRKPLYLLPFEHYEQILNATIVHEAQIGLHAKTLNRADFELFLDNLATYSRNMESANHLFQRFDGDAVFMNILHSFGV